MNSNPLSGTAEHPASGSAISAFIRQYFHQHMNFQWLEGRYLCFDRKPTDELARGDVITELRKVEQRSANKVATSTDSRSRQH